MTIDKKARAETLRLYHAEKWRIGTIAGQLGVHHTTVERVLTDAGEPRHLRRRRRSKLDPFLPFIRQTLAVYPKLTASRLYEMAGERGYRGSQSHFRRIVAHERPKPTAEAYLRLKTLPGEQAQVDWRHFGKVKIGRAERPLMGFVMVLSFSRRTFLRFYLSAGMSIFLRGHVAAFEAWQGVPRELWYDNLKSVVLERHGDAIRFNPQFLDFAGHYHFLPTPVAIARGNEKGRVERAIRYARESFFAARSWRDLDDLNTQAQAWCDGIAADRPCPEDRSMSVREAFEQERSSLIALPADRSPADERVEVSRPFRTVTAPNDVWCIDFKGWFRTRDGERCDPLTVSDAHSRFLLACVIVPPRTDTVRPLVEQLFKRYGLPLAIRSDNGAPFAGTGAGGLSRLSLGWVKAGIALERIDPGKPQQNGRHERMHRTLKAETAKPPAASMSQQQARFDRFRQDFNDNRPHEALGQQPPATFYRPSPRPYPERLDEPWYDAWHAVRRVRTDGSIKWGGDLVFISETLTGEVVGVAETDSGDWIVRFAD